MALTNLDNSMKLVEIYAHTDCRLVTHKVNSNMAQISGEHIPNQVSKTMQCANLSNVHANDLLLI